MRRLLAQLYMVAFTKFGEALGNSLRLQRSAQSLQREAASGHHRGLPKDGRVAILFRGEGFRDIEHAKPKPFCVQEAEQSQLDWTQTFMEKVVEPLEDRGNELDIVFTDVPCDMNKELVKFLGTNRVVKVAEFDSETQGDNMRQAMDVFSSTLDVKSYDLVIIVRHDLVWRKPITDWNVNFQHFLFMAHCELGAGKNVDGDYCVFDHFQFMPGELFETFHEVVSEQQCFIGLHGHDCYRPTKAAVQKANGTVSLVTDWRPNSNVKNPNGICDFAIKG